MRVFLTILRWRMCRQSRSTTVKNKPGNTNTPRQTVGGHLSATRSKLPQPGSTAARWFTSVTIIFPKQLQMQTQDESPLLTPNDLALLTRCVRRMSHCGGRGGCLHWCVTVWWPWAENMLNITGYILLGCQTESSRFQQILDQLL